MRILIHMGDSYPNESPCAKRMRTFYEALIAAGHEVRVMAPENPNGSVKDVIGVKTVPLGSKSSLNRLMNQMSIGFNSVKASKQFKNVDLVITTSPPALINFFGWIIAKRNHAKLIYDVRDIWPDVGWEMGSFKKTSLYSRIFEWNRNFMLRHSNLVLAVSRGKVQKLKNYCLKADVVYITNGLDEKFLENKENSEVIDKFNLDKIFTCVYIGNLGLAQGLMQLLRIANKAKDMPIQFILFGSGVEESILKEYAAKNGLDKVIFPGRLPNDDMLTVLKHSGMSFVSLVNENLKDSVPTKLFEALGAGCPVLLAAAGESVEILEESGLGIAVMPNDEEALWNAFLKIYQNKDEYDREAAKKVILEKYSRQKAAEDMIKEITKRFE